MKIITFCFLNLFIFLSTVAAQDFASWNKDSLVLNNGFIKREIVFKDGGLFTKSLRLKGNENNFATEKSKEFSLFIDGKYCDGHSGWILKSFEPASDLRQGKSSYGLGSGHQYHVFRNRMDRIH